MRAQNEPPETAYRVVETGEARVADRIDPEAVEQGLVWPQSRGSQLAGAAVGAQEGERVLDLCAAPGGKTTQLAKQAAEVVAVEVHPGRGSWSRSYAGSAWTTSPSSTPMLASCRRS
jgi:16S rRNA C967 or C1407 C5-methylase (RsmB/RsmF family)